LPRKSLNKQEDNIKMAVKNNVIVFTGLIPLRIGTNEL